ncbi:hypothetical protein B0H14DRAFT_3524844 [Mycena olivaceomarginata]|nr:hypothetical protein B0H14DRAFT_3524844 [Mycena olivaceomarginata]
MRHDASNQRPPVWGSFPLPRACSPFPAIRCSSFRIIPPSPAPTCTAPHRLPRFRSHSLSHQLGSLAPSSAAPPSASRPPPPARCPPPTAACPPAARLPGAAARPPPPRPPPAPSLPGLTAPYQALFRYTAPLQESQQIGSLAPPTLPAPLTGHGSRNPLASLHLTEIPPAGCQALLASADQYCKS